ncbi:uncharacterized protein LOC135499313 [Lineus longissimus]|uniref:uncharacterized protein LOC135499313 n=1 Tax=Lineus longissimus TaxID=88925 RepID=UPI00315D57EC
MKPVGLPVSTLGHCTTFSENDSRFGNKKIRLLKMILDETSEPPMFNKYTETEFYVPQTSYELHAVSNYAAQLRWYARMRKKRTNQNRSMIRGLYALCTVSVLATLLMYTNGTEKISVGFQNTKHFAEQFIRIGRSLSTEGLFVGENPVVKKEAKPKVPLSEGMRWLTSFKAFKENLTELAQEFAEESANGEFDVTQLVRGKYNGKVKKITKDLILEELEVTGYQKRLKEYIATRTVPRNGFDQMAPLPFMNKWRTPCWQHNTTSNFMCLPGFYIIGFPKCATTDLWTRLTKHHQLKGWAKELHWWTRLRYRYSMARYAKKLGDMVRARNDTRVLMGDGSPSTLWDISYLERKLRKDPGLPDKPPKVLNAHLMYKYQPNAKFIVLVRNPSDSVYSDYTYHGVDKVKKLYRDKEELHNRTIELIKYYHECINTTSIKACAYNGKVYLHSTDQKLRLFIYLYSVYIGDWLTVFPRSQVHVVRAEDYGRNTAGVLQDIFKFLEVDALPPDTLKEIAEGPRMNTNRQYSYDVGPMQASTRKLLDDFFKPFNEALAHILQDDRFLWKDVRHDIAWPVTWSSSMILDETSEPPMFNKYTETEFYVPQTSYELHAVSNYAAQLRWYARMRKKQKNQNRSMIRGLYALCTVSVLATLLMYTNGTEKISVGFQNTKHFAEQFIRMGRSLNTEGLFVGEKPIVKKEAKPKVPLSEGMRWLTSFKAFKENLTELAQEFAEESANGEFDITQLVRGKYNGKVKKITKDLILEELEVTGYQKRLKEYIATRTVPRNGFDQMAPLPFMNKWRTPCWQHNTTSNFMCLPGFYIIGFPKCATTDLWTRLTKHHQLKGWAKELHWWTRLRYRYSMARYAKKLGDMVRARNDTRVLMGDGSPSTIWDISYLERKVRKDPGLPDKPPKVLNAHLMYKYQPNAKFIVLVRNPSDSVYSGYTYHGVDKVKKLYRDKEELHNRTIELIKYFHECINTTSIKACAYNGNVYLHSTDQKLRLFIYLYSVYIGDWLTVFPRSQVHVVRTEDYGRNTAGVLQDIFKFLEVDALPPDTLKEIAEGPRMNTNRQYSYDVGPMQASTRKLLDDFFKPFNEALAHILQDDCFLWKDVRHDMSR